MIGFLRGKVAGKDSGLLLDVGGVGYRVAVTPDTLSGVEAGTEATIFTHLVVRDDAMELYGFSTTEERDFFLILIGISGIGPKKALHILASAGVETLRRAAQANDASYLHKVSGIGKKGADKLVVELQDKLGALEEAEAAGADGDVFDALKGFGYSTAEIHEVVRGLPADIAEPGERIKEALRRIGK